MKLKKLDFFFGAVIILSTFFYFFPPRMWFMRHVQQRDLNISINATFNNDDPKDPTIENLIKARYEEVGMSGQIVIPQSDVAINLPILEGVGYYNMLIGAGEQLSRSDVKMGGKGNYILASHKADWDGILFSNLRHTKVGSTIWVADEENVYVYTVNKSFETTIHGVEVLDQPSDPEKRIITLYTCKEYNSIYRYVVQGELTDTIPIDEINEETKIAFDRWLTKLGKV